jgi:hypothetical protein
MRHCQQINIIEEEMKTTLVVLAVALLFTPVVAVAHGGHPHVIGTVQQVTSSSITVKTANGAVTVPLNSETRYYRGAGTDHPATSHDVEAGMRVVVHENAHEQAAEVHIPLATTK